MAGAQGAAKLLVLNAGSSSLKFKLFERAAGGAGPPALAAVWGGVVERIGERAQLTAKRIEPSGAATPVRAQEGVAAPDHTAALGVVLDALRAATSSDALRAVAAVGHRVVHGKHISRPVVVDEGVRAVIRDAAALAPLHNPPNLAGIDAAAALFPGVPQVACFDTAFHQTMPAAAYTYALPAELIERHHLRRYGFHGTSYAFLLRQAAAALARPAHQLNLIMAHLGAGSSMCAVERGACVDTSMGLTPLEGLVMGSRSGNVDPALPGWLAANLGMTPAQVDTLLLKRSGLLGLAGQADMRTIRAAALDGDARAQLAMDVFVHRIRKYLGAYLVALRGRADALVFSGGIGEGADYVRAAACTGLEDLGFKLDPKRNASEAVARQLADAAQEGRPAVAEVQAADSRARILVIPTDEELSIAQQTLEVVEQAKAGGAAAA